MSLPRHLTNDQIKRRLLDIFPAFVSDVDPGQLCDHLIANQIITTERWKRIIARKCTQEEQCRELLLYLDSITNPRTFIVVRDALKTICPHMYEQIEHQSDTETGDANELSAIRNDHLQQNNSSLQELVEKLEQERDEARGLLNECKERLQAAEVQSKERLDELNECKEHFQAQEERILELNAFKDRFQALEAQLQTGKRKKTEDESKTLMKRRRLDTAGNRKITKDESKAVTKKRTFDITAVVMQSKYSFEMPGVRQVFRVAKLGQSIYILCEGKDVCSYAIRVYEYRNGYRFVNEISLIPIRCYLSLNGINYCLWDLVSCDKSNSLFFTDGQSIIWVVRTTERCTNDNPVKEWMHLRKGSFRLSKSQDGHLMVFSHASGCPWVEIYDASNGSRIRSCQFSTDIIDGIMLQVIEKPNGNFIIFRSLSYRNGPWVISELDRDGNMIKQFDPSNSQSLKLNDYSELCLDSRKDLLFVGNYSSISRGVDLFDANSLNLIATLLDAEDIPPHEGLLTLCYDEKNRQLITCSGNRVGVYELCS